jgi:hypothetical protein
LMEQNIIGVAPTSAFGITDDECNGAAVHDKGREPSPYLLDDTGLSVDNSTCSKPNSTALDWRLRITATRRVLQIAVFRTLPTITTYENRIIRRVSRSRLDFPPKLA